MLIVDAARGTIVDYVTDTFFRIGVPGDRDIVLSGPGESGRGSKKGGGESEEFREKGNHYGKQVGIW